MKLPDTWRRSRAGKVLLLAAGVLILWAIAGFLVLPHFLRPVAERRLAEALHRPVTLRRLSLNPFALSATLEGLDVKEKGGTGPFFSFDRLYVNLEAVSLLKGLPVVRAITLTRPSATLIRNDDGTYNFQDLLEEASKRKPEKEAPVRFSLNNIRVEEGSLDFDDRPVRKKHTLRDLKIGIPFLSNVPSQVEITTQPAFEAKVNGSPFALRGRTKPFSQTHESALEIDLADVDVPYYLAYVPTSMPAKLTSGRLDAKVTITFKQPVKGTPALLVSGTAALRKLGVEMGGKPLMSWERFDAVVDSIDVFGRKARLRSLKAVGPELWVRRGKTGGYEITAALAAPAGDGAKTTGAEPSMGKETASPPFVLEVAEIGVEGGGIHYEDLAGSRPFRGDYANVAISVKGFSTSAGKAASLEASAKSDFGETLKNTGSVSISPFLLEGEFSAGGLQLKRYQPFYADLVRFDIDDGVLDLKTRYRFAAGEKGGGTSLTGLSAALKSPRLTWRGKKEAFFRAPSVTLAETAFDLTRHKAALGEIASAGGFLGVVREKDGSVDLFKLMAEPPADRRPEQAEPWTVTLGKLALDGYTVKIADDEMIRPARYSLTKLNLTLEKLSTARGAKATLATRFGVDGKGVASAKGPVGLTPMFAELEANVRGVPLVPLQAYVLQNLKLSLAGGTVSAGGRLSFREGADGKASFVYAGKALVAGLLALDQSTNLDFVRWEAFSAEGMRAGFNPMFLEVSRLAVSGLACDITIEADGTMNLRKIIGAPTPPEEEEESAETPAAVVASAPAVPPAVPAPASAPPPAAASTPAAAPPPAAAGIAVRIDTLTLQGCRIGLADHFIQPNYSATLADVAGSVTGLSSKEGTVAQLDLRGALANHSPIQIAGSVNPFAAAAFADIKASFRDIDLPPFTPYSGKYAGYAIASGGLTMEVSYKLQNRKLAAQNRFLVDRFELGEKVESKAATKLPVKLAVSLLKDKDGLIDLDLPIEGSLDDPKFRIGKIIWKVLGNLIAKAATAPFALLGKLFGGSGQELSSLDFADGSETLDEAAKKKLDALARALENRPALKLEATGRFSGDKDLEGLKRLRLQRMVKAQKLADLAKRGEAPTSVDAVVIEEKEYPLWLAKAYKKEKFPKPRNFIGLAKELPVPEMENLMLANLPATGDDLRQLALARSNAVKDYLTGPGKVDAARVLVLEPGKTPAEPTASSRASRVDFSLR